MVSLQSNIIIAFPSFFLSPRFSYPDIPRPKRMLTVAAAPFRMPRALITGGGMRSWGRLMRKFSSERAVWAPQYLSAGTCTSPKASVSVLVLADMADRVEWKSRRVLGEAVVA